MKIDELKTLMDRFYPDAKKEIGRGWLKMVNLKNNKEILITGSEMVIGQTGETGIGKGTHIGIETDEDIIKGLAIWE